MDDISPRARSKQLVTRLSKFIAATAGVSIDNYLKPVFSYLAHLSLSMVINKTVRILDFCRCLNVKLSPI